MDATQLPFSEPPTASNAAGQKPQVLIADDDSLSRKILAAKLGKSGYDVRLATTGDEAWEILVSEDSPRLVVLDWMMPGKSGVQICELIRSKVTTRYVYVVLVTGKSQQDDIITGLQAGADDYLKKPYDFAELEARLRTGQRILDLEQRLIDAQNALHFQATHDGLTGLLNRNAVLDVLERELSRTARDQTSSVGIALIDLDHFKAINDSYGHTVGDLVLCESMVRGKEVLRPYDFLGRYGGEEFLAVLPGCSSEDAKSVAERIRARIASQPLVCDGRAIHISASLGVTCSADWPQNTEGLSLIRAADEALYRAKSAGRNRVEAAPAAPQKK